jgi:hypothetical protein
MIPVSAPTAPPEFWFQFLGLAYQDYANTEIARSCEGAINFSMWRMVASHTVENDPAR